MKKVVSFISILLCGIFVNINSVSAIGRSILIGDTEFSEEITINEDHSVEYDYENNILTLTNYNGGPIIYEDVDELTIVLNGNNIITSDYMYEGISSSTSGITIEGEGSVLIKNGSSGIYAFGDIIINNKSIDIENALYDGIAAQGGNLEINAKITMDTNETEIEEDNGYFERYSALSASKDLKINNDVVIKNAKGALDSNGNIIINGGISSIEAMYNVHAAKEFSMLGGKMDINLSAPIDYGVYAGSINIKNGYLHVCVPEDTLAIISLGEYEKEPSIIVGDSLLTTPSDLVFTEVLLTEYQTGLSYINSKDEVVTEIEFYAKRTISFDTDGGSNVSRQNIMYASLASEPTDPEKEEYTFAGWYIDDEFTEEFDFDTPVTEDITLYAKWEPIKYTIILKTNDSKMGTVASLKSEAAKDEVVIIVATPSEGYRFVEWQSEDVVMSSGIFTMPNKDVTITAIFEQITYKVSFNANNGTGTMDDVVIAGTYTLPENEFTAPEGKVFKGWSLTKDGEIVTSIEVNEDKVVYAIWEDIPKKYDYEFIKGDNQKLTLDDITEYTFTIDGDYSLFKDFKIGDLTLVKDEDYIIKEGSTIITLTDKGIDKLNKLESGKYDIKVSYTNGKVVTGTLELNEILPPDTFVVNNKNYFGIVSILSLLGMVLYIVKHN